MMRSLSLTLLFVAVVVAFLLEAGIRYFRNDLFRRRSPLLGNTERVPWIIGTDREKE